MNWFELEAKLEIFYYVASVYAIEFTRLTDDISILFSIKLNKYEHFPPSFVKISFYALKLIKILYLSNKNLLRIINLLKILENWKILCYSCLNSWNQGISSWSFLIFPQSYEKVRWDYLLNRWEYLWQVIFATNFRILRGSIALPFF